VFTYKRKIHSCSYSTRTLFSVPAVLIRYLLSCLHIVEVWGAALMRTMILFILWQMQYGSCHSQKALQLLLICIFAKSQLGGALFETIVRVGNLGEGWKPLWGLETLVRVGNLCEGWKNVEGWYESDLTTVWLAWSRQRSGKKKSSNDKMAGCDRPSLPRRFIALLSTLIVKTISTRIVLCNRYDFSVI